MIVRSLQAAATLVAVLALVFILMNMAPGDPASLALRGTPGSRGVALSERDVVAVRMRFGLDRPAPLRFVSWVRDAITLDFGRSFQNGEPVRTRIGNTAPVTVAMNVMAVIFATFLALVSTLASLTLPGGWLERSLTAFFDVLFATPPFVLGLLLLLVFAVRLGAIPVLGGEGTERVLLPALTLGLVAVAPLFAYFRAVLGDAFHSVAAMAARARGEGTLGILVRSLRRSGGPLAALVTSLVPSLVAGSVLVERLFSVGGAGELLTEAVLSRDYPLVLGLTFLSAASVSCVSLLGDISAAVLDPRLREAHSRGVNE